MLSHKQAESFPGRNFYKGKGVDWPRFLPWLLAAFIVAAILIVLFGGLAAGIVVNHHLDFAKSHRRGQQRRGAKKKRSGVFHIIGVKPKPNYSPVLLCKEEIVWYSANGRISIFWQTGPNISIE